MTILVVDTLETTTEQEITLTERAVVSAVRPYLYFHNDPAGTFTMSIKQSTTTLASKSLTIAEIISGAGWTAGQYHHGFLRFQFDDIVVLNPETYTLELSASGYSFAEASYIGWVKEHEFITNNTTALEFGSTLDNPHSNQLWSYQ